MKQALKIFITYSHRDTRSKEELVKCLSVLIQNDEIEIWHDNEILPFDKREGLARPRPCNNEQRPFRRTDSLFLLSIRG